MILTRLPAPHISQIRRKKSLWPRPRRWDNSDVDKANANPSTHFSIQGETIFKAWLWCGLWLCWQSSIFVKVGDTWQSYGNVQIYSGTHHNHSILKQLLNGQTGHKKNLRRYELTWQTPWTLQRCPPGNHQPDEDIFRKRKSFVWATPPLSWAASTIRLFRRKSEVMLVALILREVDDEWCVHKDKQTHIQKCKQRQSQTLRNILTSFLQQTRRNGKRLWWLSHLSDVWPTSGANCNV